MFCVVKSRRSKKPRATLSRIEARLERVLSTNKTEQKSGLKKWAPLIVLMIGAIGFGMWTIFSHDEPLPDEEKAPPPKRYIAQVVRSYPQDPDAYTQVLLFHDGFLYESTGKIGHSSLRKVELKSGRVIQQHDLGGDYFGEGLALHDGRLTQITWQNERGFVYELESLKQLKTFSYDGDGWGLTTDGAHLIMSDGSSVIYFRDPKSFEVVRKIEVRDHLERIRQINELEYIDGEIYANVLYRDQIFRISPKNGHVLGVIECSHLLGSEGIERSTLKDPHDAVLNGIAYDAKGKRLFLTGKHWPKLFEVRIVPE